MVQQEVIKRKIRGIYAERELVVKLWKLGFAVIRGPASGSRVKKSVYPDLVIIKNKHIFVLEIKSRSKLSNIYIDREQIEKLKEFARRAGGEALVAIKISSLRIWKAIPITQINEFSSSKVKIDRNVLQNAEDLISYINKRVNLSLDNYISKFNSN